MAAMQPISETCEWYHTCVQTVQMFGKPSMLCLCPMRTCFSVTHLRVTEYGYKNDSVTTL